MERRSRRAPYSLDVRRILIGGLAHRRIRIVLGSPVGVGALRHEPLAEVPLRADRESVIVRLRRRGDHIDVAEARVEAIEAVVEQIPSESVDVVGVVEVPPGRAQVVRLDHDSAHEISLHPEEPVVHVGGDQIRIYCLHVHPGPSHAVALVEPNLECRVHRVTERGLGRVTEVVTECRAEWRSQNNGGAKRRVAAVGLRREVHETVERETVAPPHRHLSVPQRIPGEPESRRNVVVVGRKSQGEPNDTLRLRRVE